MGGIVQCSCWTVCSHASCSYTVSPLRPSQRHHRYRRQPPAPGTPATTSTHPTCATQIARRVSDDCAAAGASRLPYLVEMQPRASASRVPTPSHHIHAAPHSTRCQNEAYASHPLHISLGSDKPGRRSGCCYSADSSCRSAGSPTPIGLSVRSAGGGGVGVVVNGVGWRAADTWLSGARPTALPCPRRRSALHQCRLLSHASSAACTHTSAGTSADHILTATTPSEPFHSFSFHPNSSTTQIMGYMTGQRKRGPTAAAASTYEASTVAPQPDSRLLTRQGPLGKEEEERLRRRRLLEEQLSQRGVELPSDAEPGVWYRGLCPFCGGDGGRELFSFNMIVSEGQAGRLCFVGLAKFTIVP